MPPRHAWSNTRSPPHPPPSYVTPHNPHITRHYGTREEPFGRRPRGHQHGPDDPRPGGGGGGSGRAGAGGDGNGDPGCGPRRAGTSPRRLCADAPIPIIGPNTRYGRDRADAHDHSRRCRAALQQRVRSGQHGGRNRGERDGCPALRARGGTGHTAQYRRDDPAAAAAERKGSRLGNEVCSPQAVFWQRVQYGEVRAYERRVDDRGAVRCGQGGGRQGRSGQGRERKGSCG